MGSLAVESLMKGETAKVTVVQNGKVTLEKLETCVKKNDEGFTEFKTLAEKLSI